VVFHWQVSTLTTTWLSRDLQFEPSGVPHSVKCPGLQSRWHTSNASEWDTLPQHCAFRSQSQSLDHLVHLKTATLSETTTHRVNGFPALQWLEVWIQFSLLLQFASPHCFLSCTNGTYQKSPNSMHSVWVGLCLMVSLSMLRYHRIQGGYSIPVWARQ
jgi:hypothetical protein